MAEIIRKSIHTVSKPITSDWLRLLYNWIKRRPLSQREKRWMLMRQDMQQSQQEKKAINILK